VRPVVWPFFVFFLVTQQTKRNLANLTITSKLVIHPSFKHWFENYHHDQSILNCAVSQITNDVKLPYVVVTCLSNENELGSEQVQEIKASRVITTVPIFQLKNIRFYPPLDVQRQRAIKTTAFGSYIKIQLRLDPVAKTIFNHCAQNCGGSIDIDTTGEDSELFTVLTDDILGAIYNSSHDFVIVKVMFVVDNVKIYPLPCYFMVSTLKNFQNYPMRILKVGSNHNSKKCFLVLLATYTTVKYLFFMMPLLIGR